ncbi:MAG TPA: DUF4760 domain-containing protein [Candidatus Rubrimentiphilum sp.]|nr:DUF4760 domain-containing protein [Candidatus Rubrimentiphilum sp.]
MSPEVWTAVGSLVSAVVIAATAIAALIQIRQLRTGNAINAMLTLRSNFSDAQFSDAMDVLRGSSLATAMQDPSFRAFVARRAPAPSDAATKLYRAYVHVANWYEVLGAMVLQNVLTMRAVGDTYANVVNYAWTLCEPAIIYMRAVRRDQTIFEAFECLTVLSRQWMRDHPSVYPPGVPRIAAANKYPIEEEAS